MKKLKILFWFFISLIFSSSVKSDTSLPDLFADTNIPLELDSERLEERLEDVSKGSLTRLIQNILDSLERSHTFWYGTQIQQKTFQAFLNKFKEIKLPSTLITATIKVGKRSKKSLFEGTSSEFKINQDITLPFFQWIDFFKFYDAKQNNVTYYDYNPCFVFDEWAQIRKQAHLSEIERLKTEKVTADIPSTTTTTEVLPTAPAARSVPVKSEYTFTSRGVLIFLDDSKTDLLHDAIGEAAVVAINQQSGPIIVSSSILANIIQFTKNAATIIASESKEKAANIALFYCNLTDEIKWDDFVIKKINDSLILILPVHYLNKIQIDINETKKSNAGATETTPLELKLGLRVNHMNTIDNIADINKPDQQFEFAEYFINALFNNTTQKSSIFCTRSEYQQNIPLPIWSIYLNGHGKVNDSIAHLSLDDFKKFLHFLEKHINTKLLIYLSCYAAGINADKIYGSQHKWLAKQYSFPIITCALTDAPVYTRTGSTKYTGFFNEITKSEIDYKKAILYLQPMSSHEQRGGTPQIKLPGLEWFSVMDIQDKTVKIGSILAYARDPDKPLDINKFFNPHTKKERGAPTEEFNPTAILLYALDIPFELIINSESMSAIISMLPGKKRLKIKKISTQKHSYKNVLGWFAQIEDLSSYKVFFINEIQANDKTIRDIIIFNPKKTPHPESDRQFQMFFTDMDEKTYKATAKYKDHNFTHLEIIEVTAPKDKSEHIKMLKVATQGKGRPIQEIIEQLKKHLRLIKTPKQPILGPKIEPAPESTTPTATEK